MPLLSFFLRRFIIGALARQFTTQLTRRFNVSPGVANIIFAIATEALAQASERVVPAPPQGASKAAGKGGKPWSRK